MTWIFIFGSINFNPGPSHHGTAFAPHHHIPIAKKLFGNAPCLRCTSVCYVGLFLFILISCYLCDIFLFFTYSIYKYYLYNALDEH